MLRTSVADLDPGTGAFLSPGSGSGKKSRSGSRINIPDHISESFETVFWLKILKILLRGSGIWDGKKSDPGSRMEKIRIRYVYPRSRTTV
jgi:hypothetical protein